MYTNWLLCQDGSPHSSEASRLKPAALTEATIGQQHERSASHIPEVLPHSGAGVRYLTPCGFIYDTEIMKAFLALVVIGLIVVGSYSYFKIVSLGTITITTEVVTYEAGDYGAKLLDSREFQNTYMLFGGGYFEDKNLMNPIALAGIEIADAKRIYARYPDFHLCASPGAALAQPKVKHLNLIPADGQVLDELMATIEEYEDNLGNDGDRVCVSLTGEIQVIRSALPEHNIGITDQPLRQTFHLIHSSERIDCKSLLD